MLPPSKVGMYLKYGKIAPEEHHDTALFLSDIEGFTAIASKSEPYQVMEMLDKLYRIMDHVAKKSPRLYKLETIGDAYVITSGLFNSDHPEENAIAIANFALIVREAVALVVSPVDNTPIRIRIGINSGDVMSGVIGDLMPRWCLFGDTL
jgi:guanylate cyclase soluble subunit beta